MPQPYHQPHAPSPTQPTRPTANGLCYPTMLFDLDGTLTDPGEGIVRCIAFALEKLQCPVPEPAALHAWIGPTLRESFADYLGDATLAEQAMTFFRERYATLGIFENRLYPGIPALLATLQEQGGRIFLATGKPQPYAQRILEHFHLLPFFHAVGGATFDGTVSSKAEIITTLLPHLGPLDPATCVMIGDREHDVYGARAHGLPCITVSYGYGTLDELRLCAPDQIVHSVDELAAALLGSGENPHDV